MFLLCSIIINNTTILVSVTKQSLPIIMEMISIAATLLLLLLAIFLRQYTKSSKLPPGPRPLPIIGNFHLLGQQPYRSLATLAKKYGPIMSLRLGQVPTVVISSPQAAELFLKKHDAVFASRPVIRAWLYGTKGLVAAPYGDHSRLVRGIMTQQLLSPAKVQEFEGLRRSETEAEIERLKVAAAAREVVDVGVRVGELVENITFKMVVGKGKEEGKSFPLREVVDEALALAAPVNLADFVPFLAPFDLQGITRKVKAVMKKADVIFENIIEDHLKEEDSEKHNDILGAMLHLVNNEKHDDEIAVSSSFDRENVKGIMYDLFAASIDTTTLTIIWAISALLKNSKTMNRLQQELDAIVGRERMVNESDLPKLSYLDMVVKETLRLYPAGPLMLPHESMEDIVVDGYRIPKKTRIVVNVWSIGHDQKVWSENAEEFNPERFMGRDIGIRGRDFELLPFGSGRRGCPGLNLSMVMVKLIVAQLVHNFDWELPNGMQTQDLDMTEKCGLTMTRANGLLAIPLTRQ